MAASKPITKAQRAKVIELHGTGQGRNAIAQAVGIGAATVTKIVHEAGLTFDRAATRAATEAKQADSRSRRAEIASGLLDDVEKIRGKFWSGYVWVGNSKDGPETITLEEPDAPALKAYVQAAATLLTKHVDLERHDADAKAGAAKSMLTELGKALGLRVDDAAA